MNKLKATIKHSLFLLKINKRNEGNKWLVHTSFTAKQRRKHVNLLHFFNQN